jgi:prepilin-type N-terminal cleavage/methylation domain-containing protein
MMTSLRRKRGFTLIELMVVIAIIGLLATIITASLSTARAKGRDAKRIADIKTIQTALDLYYNDNYKYPTALSSLVPNYLPVMPTDPSYSVTSATCVSAPSTAGCYKYTAFASSGTLCNAANPPIKYHIGAALEQTSNSALSNDVDAALNNNSCSGAAADFDGTSVGCTGTAGTPQPGGTETCYDFTN